MDKLLESAENKSTGNYKFFKDSWNCEHTAIEQIILGKNGLLICLYNEEDIGQKTLFQFTINGVNIYLHKEGKRETLFSTSREYRHPLFRRITDNYLGLIGKVINEFEEGKEVTEEYITNDDLNLSYPELISSKITTPFPKDNRAYLF